MSASRTGRPRAACRSTNRAASTAAVASAALPTAYARTRPPVTTTDRSRPSTSNSSTNVASPTSSTSRSTSRPARTGPVPFVTPTRRLRCWMAFSSRARSRSSMLVDSSSSRASDSRRSLARRAARRPASSRSRGGRVAGWASVPRQRSLHHSCVRGRAWTAWVCASRASSSPRADASARSSVLPSVARWSSSASRPRRQACHTPRTSPRWSRSSASASHAVARTSPDGWRR